MLSDPASPTPRFGVATRVLRAVRRRLLLHRRLVAALLVGVAAYATLQVLRPPAPATVPVLISAADLPAGTTLTADNVVQVRRDHETVPDGRLDAAIGRVLAAPVRRGEALTDARVVGSGLTRAAPGSVALSVRIADAPALDLVRVGDAIDVIAVPATGVEGTSNQSRVLLRGAMVLALPTEAPSSVGGEVSRVVTLEVPRIDTVEVSQASAREWLTVAVNQ